jgi:intracellular sulfur oxidation DsrE/DsrF family protein
MRCLNRHAFSPMVAMSGLDHHVQVEFEVEILKLPGGIGVEFLARNLSISALFCMLAARLARTPVCNISCASIDPSDYLV